MGCNPTETHVPYQLIEAGVSGDLAKRLGVWTEAATAARYDHAERVEEMR